MERNEKSLSQAAFAADELRLFLDTHPNERKALEAYRSATAEVAQRKKERPCAVSALDAGKNGNWDWVKSPWPWETEA